MPKENPESSPVAKFKVGDKVRVKHGVADVDYPDIPMGGWVGEVTKVDKNGMYTIRWSQETLAAIHPVIKKRCEADGLVMGEYGLADDDLEPDRAGLSTSTSLSASPLGRFHPKTKRIEFEWYSD